jgi:ABC-type polysaccharide/polyol phosphate export permease
MSKSRSDDWTLFAANYNLGHNVLRSCINIADDLRSHVWQIWMIFKSGFTASFRQTALGLFWGFAMPLVPLLAFFILTLLRVFPEHDSISPLGYMAVGVTVWLYLQGLVMAPTLAVEIHAPVLKSTGFPMICVFVASYGRHAFEMVVRIAAVAPILLYYFDLSLFGFGVVLILLLPASAFCVALGILLALAGIVFKDLKNVMDIFFRYLIFISFAIFPISLSGGGLWVYSLNPFAIFIDNVRSMLMLGELSMPNHFFVASGVSVLFLVLSLHFYHVLERRIASAL